MPVRKAEAVWEGNLQDGKGTMKMASGAYERAQRTISVARLQRLAGVYRMPVDRLLPSDDATGDAVIDLRDSAATAAEELLRR